MVSSDVCVTITVFSDDDLLEVYLKHICVP